MNLVKQQIQVDITNQLWDRIGHRIWDGDEGEDRPIVKLWFAVQTLTWDQVSYNLWIHVNENR